VSSAIPTGPAVTSVDEAIARMESIAAALPASDGVACFNRMYLEVTQDVNSRISQGFFADGAFMAHLDVVFANLYFDAVDALMRTPTKLPAAWAPLLTSRGESGIYPIQFALAGMNAHINHDLPLALVEACTQLDTSPEDSGHHADYQKVDALLDAAEQSVRQSFESSGLRRDDKHVQAVLDVVGDWSINSARDVAWETATELWRCRHVTSAANLLMDGLAHTVGMASRLLLIAA
jgi:Family of unknown function (DUF5995)